MTEEGMKPCSTNLELFIPAALHRESAHRINHIERMNLTLRNGLKYLGYFESVRTLLRSG
ncbi:MAG: hypothetical protein K1X81_01655 [Bacteroidia bacterium]|nr:hypothetical protein [Bacteroidia bacterium]